MSDNLKIGEMRSYVKAMRKTQSKSAGGQLIAAWTYAFHFYAAIGDVQSNESFSSLLPGIQTTTIFSTWLRSNITRDMRIVDGEDEYQITSITKGFKTMNIKCERVES